MQWAQVANKCQTSDQGAITALVTPPPHECWQAHKALHKAGKTLKLSSQEEEEDSEECCVQIEV